MTLKSNDLTTIVWAGLIVFKNKLKLKIKLCFKKFFYSEKTLKNELKQIKMSKYRLQTTPKSAQTFFVEN